jgi:hypothetical protein
MSDPRGQAEPLRSVTPPKDPPPYAVMHGHVVQRHPDERACTCASPGPEWGHEQHCGWEPVIPVAALIALGFTAPDPAR